MDIIAETAVGIRGLRARQIELLSHGVVPVMAFACS